MKIRPVGTGLLNENRQTDRHDEVNRSFLLSANAPKNTVWLHDNS